MKSSLVAFDAPPPTGRDLRLPRAGPQEADAMRRWAERRREALLEDRLDRLATVLERLVAALERRAS